MPRIARMVVGGEQAVYDVISRTALEGYVLGAVPRRKNPQRLSDRGHLLQDVYEILKAESAVAVCIHIPLHEGTLVKY